MEASKPVDGPPIVEPSGLLPLMPFAKPMGFELPLFTTQRLWEDVVRHAPYALCSKLNNAVNSALATKRADYAAIDFTFRYDEEEGGKVKRVRLRVMLNQTSEGIPWVMLNLAPLPLRFRNGRSGG